MTQTPGPLEASYDQRNNADDGWFQTGNPRAHEEFQRIYGILDSLPAPAAVVKDYLTPDVEPIGYTGSGSLEALKRGSEGYMWPTPAKSHPLPVYAAPYPPAAKTDWDKSEWIKVVDGQPAGTFANTDERLKVAVEALEMASRSTHLFAAQDAARNALSRIKALSNDQ